MSDETTRQGPLERLVGRLQPDRTSGCELGCNGGDDCVDYDTDDSDDPKCPCCDGDGMDPMTDYVLTCPVCGGMG